MAVRAGHVHKRSADSGVVLIKISRACGDPQRYNDARPSLGRAHARGERSLQPYHRRGARTPDRPSRFWSGGGRAHSLATLRDPDVRGVRLCLGTAAEHRRDRPEQRDVHEHRRWRIAQPTGLRAHGTTVASTLRRRDGLPDRVDVADHVHGRPGRGLARHALAGARLSQYQPDRSRQRVGRQSGGNRACGRGAWGQSHRDRRTRAAGRQLRAADGGLETTAASLVLARPEANRGLRTPGGAIRPRRHPVPQRRLCDPRCACIRRRDRLLLPRIQPRCRLSAKAERSDGAGRLSPVLAHQRSGEAALHRTSAPSACTRRSSFPCKPC